MLDRLNDYVGTDLSNTRPFHCGIYALNMTGKKNLYKLVSMSHTEYFKRVPCIPKSKLQEMRDGLLVLYGCEKGEFFETVLNKTEEEAEEIADFYDVLGLYNIPYEQISVLLHPESIIHSFVEFRDSSIIAQLGNPYLH